MYILLLIQQAVRLGNKLDFCSVEELKHTRENFDLQKSKQLLLIYYSCACLANVVIDSTIQEYEQNCSLP